MNRREFLASLLSLGGCFCLPIDGIAAASEQEISKTWEELLSSPVVFYVREFGTLTTDPTYDSWPSSRGEVYAIQGPRTRADLDTLAIENQWVRGIIEDTLYEADLDSIDALDEEQLSDLICRVADWVSGSPDERDAEYVTLSGRDGQGAALWYFRDQFEYCDEFNIVIVEGDCPGSSYFGAELRMPLEAANDLAVALGVPIQFQWLGF